MKKMIIISFVFILAFSISSCSKKPSDILLSVKPCWDNDDRDCAKAFYTKESVKKLEEEEMKSRYIKVDKKKKGFADGLLKWEVVKEDIQGDSATVKIIFTEHPKEKLKGGEMTYLFLKEDAEWKIDVIASVVKNREKVNEAKAKKGDGGLEKNKKPEKPDIK